MIPTVQGRNIEIRGIRFQGTWAHKANPDDRTYTGVGEHGIRCLQTGTIVLRDVTCRYCDGAPLMLDGAWQTWTYGGYFKQCGRPLTATGAVSGRSCSQTWMYAPNIQKNNVAQLLIEDHNPGTGLTDGNDFGPSQFTIFGGIIEFSLSATDDTDPTNYDPNYRALVWGQQFKSFRMLGTHLAHAKEADEGSPAILLGSERAGSLGRCDNFVFTDGYIQPNNGVPIAFAKSNADNFARVGDTVFDNISFNTVGARPVVDLEDVLPEGVLSFNNCGVGRFGEGDRKIPLSFRDIKTGPGNDYKRAWVRFRGPEGEVFNQVPVPSFTIANGATYDFTVFVPGVRPGALATAEARPEPVANGYDTANLSGVTWNTTAVTEPNKVVVRFTNSTGVSVTTPDFNVMVVAYNRQDIARERSQSFSIAPGTIADGARVSAPLSMFGVELGDVLWRSYNQDLQGCTLHVDASSAGNIRYTIHNDTGASVTLAPGVLFVEARKY